MLLAGMMLLILANGFFVAAEFSLVRARRGRLDPADPRSALVLRQLDDVGRYLASCQFGITLASLGIGFLGEPAIASLAEPVLGGVLSHSVALIIALIFAYAISTVAHITIGEQVPKMAAVGDAERFARLTARPLERFTRACSPAVSGLHALSNRIGRLFGIDPDAASERSGGREELKQLIAESLAGGSLDEHEAEMLSGVFDLGERRARDVMTPFHDVVGVAETDSVQTAIERSLESGHSRLPVVSSGGAVTGVVLLADLVRAERSSGRDTPVSKVVQPAVIVPETRPLDALLEDLQRAHATLAVVVDEYGRTGGVVTVEDIVEEIVGEIVDESDIDEPAIRHTLEGELLVDGDVPVADLSDEGIDLPSGDYVSVGGLVTARLGRIARPGDQVQVDGHRLTVDGVEDRRIGAVRIRAADGPREADEG
ncbi:MAG: magnesium and cobalt exporter, family [Solirubrobacteraceae bacterium]|nr:magnesium and cobalt exporter, family [Solirubrobacteraceae bacterium]